jgi:competence protein ComGC
VARPPATTPYAAPPSTGIGAVGSDASAPITTSPEKKSRKGLVIAIVAIVAALLLCCCGVLFAIAIPAFSGSQKSSQEKTCFSNERMIEGAAQTSIADHDGVSPTSLAELVPDYLQAVPRCPAGGNYSFDTGDGTVTCSVHGHF